MDIEHKPAYIANIAVSVVVFVVAIIFNIFASGAFGKNGLFVNQTGAISNVLYLEITPAGWTFSIWGFIYVWQLLWLTYAVTTIWRRTSYGFLYVIPAVIPPAFYVLFTLNMACNIAWLLLWDRLYPEFALVFICLMALTLYMCLFISYHRVHMYGAILQKENQGREIWLSRLLLQNGLAMYATLVSIAALLNLGVVLVYRAGLSQPIASNICLALLTVEIITWFYLDNFVLDVYVRYTFTPYIVLVIALTGCFVQRKDLVGVLINPTFTAFLLALGCLATVLKILIMAGRHARTPIFPSASSIYVQKHDYGTNSM